MSNHLAEQLQACKHSLTPVFFLFFSMVKNYAILFPPPPPPPPFFLFWGREILASFLQVIPLLAWQAHKGICEGLRQPSERPSHEEWRSHPQGADLWRGNKAVQSESPQSGYVQYGELRLVLLQRGDLYLPSVRPPKEMQPDLKRSETSTMP